MEPPNPVNAQLRQLPAVDRLVELAGRGTRLARWSLLAAGREVLAQTRTALRAGDPHDGVDPERLAARARARASELERPHPRPVLTRRV